MTSFKIGIMQPYFLPYIGYFQLVAMVDKFVVFDDVNYIQRGWINRNRLLVNDAPFTFTIPLSHSSQNRSIRETQIAEIQWKSKLLRTIEQAYSKAPQFSTVFELCQRIIQFNTTALNVFLLNSLSLIADYLGLQTTIVATSSIYENVMLSGQERIIDICKKENANKYVNLIGGISLYQHDQFLENGIDLRFLRSQEIQYKQFEAEFVPSLSILDVMMFNDIASIKGYIEKCDLISAPLEKTLGGSI